jgi:hypothetical protein
MELRSERVRRQDKEEKEVRCKSAPQYTLYIASRSKFAHFDTPTRNAIFGSLEAQVRTLCSGCVSGWLRIMFLSCLDSADEFCTTAGRFHVSGRAEPLVAHEACQVCQYCNDRVAITTDGDPGGDQTQKESFCRQEVEPICASFVLGFDRSSTHVILAHVRVKAALFPTVLAREEWKIKTVRSYLLLQAPARQSLRL